MSKRSIENFSQEDIDSKIDEIWNEVVVTSKSPSPETTPKAFVFGGPPGAGKSSSMDKVAAEYLNRNAIVISGDDYRRYHPNFKQILEKYGDEWSLKTSKWSAAVYERIFEKATMQKYNIQIEGTFRDTKIVLKTLDRLKDKGYIVNIAVVAASRALSEKSIKERYDKQKEAGQHPRAVSTRYLDEYYPKFTQNMEDIFNAKKHHLFLIYRREEGKGVEKVFDNTRDKTSSLKDFINSIIFYRIHTHTKQTNIQDFLKSRKSNQKLLERDEGISRERKK